MEQLEQKNQVDIIYTDFRKAFDQVDHDVILRKLSEFGASPTTLKFFSSYLQNRTFTVKFAGKTSGKFTANSGVPQEF